MPYNLNRPRQAQARESSRGAPSVHRIIIQMFRSFSRVFVSALPRVAPRVAFGAAFVSVVGAGMTASTVYSAAAPLPPVKSVPFTGIPGTKYERSFVAIKPDGVERHIIGEIIGRFERKGYKLVAMKLVHPTKEMAAAHYSDLSTKPFFPGLVDFFSSGPIVAMVWEGQGAALGIRQMMGTTDPSKSLPGSIRGDLCVITGRNIVHGSDAPESAQYEISQWFKPEEVCSYEPSTDKWVYEK